MLRLMIFGALLFVVAACSGSPPPKERQFSGDRFADAGIAGSHTLPGAEYASRRFSPHRNTPVVIHLEDKPDGQHVRGTFPLVGAIDCMVVKGKWLHGPAYEWRGEIQAAGEPWDVRITVDVYGGTSISISDHAYDGVAEVDVVSSTIIWWPHEVPLAAG